MEFLRSINAMQSDRLDLFKNDYKRTLVSIAILSRIGSTKLRFIVLRLTLSFTIRNRR